MMSLSFRAQLLMICLAISGIPLVLGILLTSSQASDAAREQVTRQLESLRGAKQQQIEGYFAQIRGQITTMAQNGFTVQAMQGFRQSFDELASEKSPGLEGIESFYRDSFGERLSESTGKITATDSLIPTSRSGIAAQHRYISNNAHGLGEKDRMNDAGDGSAYSDTHRKFHPTFRAFLKEFGYYDVFLVEPDNGDIVYSVFKEVDFATSLHHGPYKTTNFARVVRDASQLTEPGQAILADFKPYLPSYGAPAAFIASPIFVGTELLGVLVFQMPVDRINAIMQQSDGLGETGETVLIGPDQRMRSQSRLTEESTLLGAQIENEAAIAATDRQTGTLFVEDGEGTSVLSAFAPLNIEGLSWSVLSSIGGDEAFAAVGRIRKAGFVIAVAVTLVVVPFVIWYVTRLRRQLGADPAELRSVAMAIAEGDVSQKMGDPSTNSGVYASMQTMQANIREWRAESKTTGEEQRRIIDDTVRVLGALAEGDLSQQIDNHYEGAFAQLKSDANATVESLRRERDQAQKTEQEMEAVVGAAKMGDLSKRVCTLDKAGFFLTMGEGTNALIEIAAAIIGDTNRVLSAVAQGDLTKRIDANYEGQFQQLKSGVNSTVERLVQIMRQIQSSADAVANGADELSSGSTDLAQRTDHQRANLETTASSMEEITVAVRQNAENAGLANQLANVAREHAVTGGSAVERAVSSMQDIVESSRRIADILTVIDEIAFQTNLLALNAAVEAARAGEHGRGFAVVASEVRNLAGRSAEAAKEIKELIKDSVSKVNSGSTLVNESGRVLEEIVKSVNQVTEIVSEIAAAGREQTSGIEQVNNSVTQMETTTQQNSSLVSQAAASSSEIGRRAQQLNELVAIFRFDSPPLSNSIGLPAGATVELARAG
ncbi:MAG: methyl-accepting chemotaxis protein [Gammaproteobacteria bacterium]|jgi:methyl-accepting chemotaxis protein